MSYGSPTLVFSKPSPRSQKTVSKNYPRTPWKKLTLIQFIKYSLGVHKKASNVGSWGETGRYPLGITILKQVVSYFNNLAVKGDDGTLLQHAFIEQKKLGLPWYTNITKLVTNLADIRTALTRLRISAHNLNIERGRYSRSDNALAIQRLCPYCCTSDVAYLSELPFPDEDPIIEDEAHVLSTCPAYHHVRLMLPDNLKTALLKRDYLTVFALMDNHQTAFMMGKATQKMLLIRKNMELKN